MRIIYLHQYFNTPSMAGSTRSYEFGKRLVEKGHDVQIITTRRTIEGGDERGWVVEEIDGIKVHWLLNEYSNNMSFYKRVWSFLYFAIYSSIRGIKLKGDLIFATSTPLTIAIPALLVSKLLNVPLVFEVRDLWPELPIAIGAIKNKFVIWCSRKLEKVAYKNSKSVVALSPGMAAGVVNAGYDESRIAVLPNCCDRCFSSFDDDEVKLFLEHRGLSRDQKLIVYAGTFGEINGVDYLVELAYEAKLISENIVFLLVGAGRDYEKVTELARAKGVLNNNLFIEPSIEKKSIPTLLRAATVSCSLFIDMEEMQANSANKFFDSLASGTPVLINYGGWQKDLIVEKDIGLVLYKKPMQLAAKELIAFVGNEQRLAESIHNASEVGFQLFDRDRLSDCFERVLQNVIINDGKQANRYSYDS